jgi:hypothetical protein
VVIAKNAPGRRAAASRYGFEVEISSVPPRVHMKSGREITPDACVSEKIPQSREFNDERFRQDGTH